MKVSFKKACMLIIGLSFLWQGEAFARRHSQDRDIERAKTRYRKALHDKYKADRRVIRARRELEQRRSKSRSCPPQGCIQQYSMT